MMKKLLLLIFSIFTIGAVFSQTPNNIYGKQRFMDSMFLNKNKNNANNSYVLSTDANGKVINVLVQGGGVDSSTKVLPPIGSIIWVNGFNFSNTVFYYQILGRFFSTPAGNFAISASDTVPRYTVVFADTLGHIGTIDGTYSGGIAQVPNVNPRSQIQLALYFIPANATQPYPISNTVVYKEDVEWTGFSNISGANFAYTFNPYQGIYSTYVPNFTNSQYVYYYDGADHSKSNYQFLSFYIRLGTAFTSGNSIQVYLRDASGTIAYATITSGQYGFNGALVNSYQLVALDFSSFVPIRPTNTFSSIEFQFQGSGGAVQFDNVILQTGGGGSFITGVQSLNSQTGNVTTTVRLNFDTTKYLFYTNNVLSDSVLIPKVVAVAGTNMTITTNATRDTATFNATGGGGGTDTSLTNLLNFNQVPHTGLVVSKDSVTFFGDSYTEGYGATSPAYRWTTLLCGFMNAVENNKGVAGTTLEKRVPQDYMAAPNMIDNLPNVPIKTFKQKLLVIAYGLNDMGQTAPAYNATNYGIDYDSVIHYITETKGWNAKDILLIPPYWIGQAGYNEYATITGNAAPTLARHLAFVDTTEQVARRWGTQYFNIFNDQLYNDTTLLVNSGGDYIHANDSGHLYIARDIAKYLGANFNSWNNGGNSIVTGQYLGTNNAQPLVMKTNGIARLQVGSDGVITHYPGVPQTLQYYFYNGAGINFGIGIANAAPYVQSFSPDILLGWSWNKGGDLQTTGVNEMMRLDGSGLKLASLPFLTNDKGGFGTVTPHASAQVDIVSTTKGFKPPVMTNAQMNAIVSPIAGLMVANSDSSNRIFIWTGTAWRGLSFTAEANSGAKKAYPSLVISNDSISQRYNVMAYGADNTGVMDATVAIQAAINACNAGGGGTVFFPNGRYKISGALGASNSQLYIPTSTPYVSTRNHITLKGETKPNFIPVNGGLPPSGTIPIDSATVILQSTLITGASGASIIGTSLAAGSTYNETFLSVENLTMQVKNNPAGGGPVIGGINYKNGSSLQCQNVVINIDTAGYKSILPVNDISGIETPDNSSETFNSISNTLIVGFKSGYKIGEHVVLSQAQAMTCYYGFNFKQGHHTSTSIRSGSFWNAYDIYISGFCTIANFQLDVEWQQIGKWYDAVNTIKDSLNVAKGNIYYTIVAAGVGVDNTKFSKSGGTNVYAAPNLNQVMTLDSNGVFNSLTRSFLGFNNSSSGTNTGISLSKSFLNKWYLYNKGSASDLFTIANSDINGNTELIKLTQGGNFGIGTASTPLYPLHVETPSSIAAYFQGTTASSQTTFYLENNRGSFASYGGFLYGGSTQSSSLFGVTRADKLFMFADGANNLGMYVGTLAAQPFVIGTNNTQAVTVSSSQALRFHALGAGALQSDASGNITVSSDERLKTNIQYYKSGLKELMKLKPIQYKWNKLSGNEMKETYAGFSAQNVKANIPLGTGENKDGYLSLQDRAIMATLVNAVQEQQKQIEELKEEIKKLKK